MSDVLKISGPLKVGSLAADPSNATEGYIYFNTSAGAFRLYENGAFRELSAEEVAKLGTLNASPTNYTPTGGTYAGHLEGIDSALGSVSSDAAGTTYTPSVLTDWDGDADPGNVDGALDQLAERVDDSEISISTNAGDISTNSGNIAANTSDIADIRTTQGTSDGDTNLGTFTGTTISDSNSVKGALQELETSVETKADSSVVTEIDGNVDDLITLSGVAENTTDLGTFTGSTITDSSTVKTALQELETEVETKAASADVVLRDGTQAFTADQSMGGNKLTNVAAPTADTDVANKAYVDAIKQGLDVKDSVRAASTANVSLTGGATLSMDGVSLANGDRVLLKDQSTPSQNGIYTVSGIGTAYTLSRATDADADAEVTAGMFTFVTEGSTQADTGWVLTTDDPITVDTTALSFSQFSGAGQVVAGDGLAKTGNTLSVNVDGEGIEISADNLTIELDGSTLSKSASGLRVAAQTANRALISDGSGNLSASAVTSTELGQLSGITENVQTGLDSKLENVSEDTTPQLGGDLDVSGFAVEDPDADLVLAGQNSVRRAKQASKASFVEEEYIHAISLSASQTDTVITDLTFAHATYEGMEIVYKVKEATSNDVRIGTIRVVTNGTAVALNDVSTETADTGISFSAVVNGANINIRYTSGTNGATMRADVKRFLT